MNVQVIQVFAVQMVVVQTLAVLQVIFFSEGLILESINPKYNNRLFVEYAQKFSFTY